jgi:hypothetical protein
MDEYFCHLDPASVREGDIVFVNSFLLCECPRLWFYLHSHHLCSRERKLGTFVLPEVHTRYICAPGAQANERYLCIREHKQGTCVLPGAQMSNMYAPGLCSREHKCAIFMLQSTNQEHLCSREHTQVMIVLARAQLPFVCAPASTNERYLSQMSDIWAPRSTNAGYLCTNPRYLCS